MKITKCLLKIFVFQIIIAIFSLDSYALEKPTHFEINQYIAKNNIGGFSLDEYLKEQLGFQEGVAKILEQSKIKKIKGEPPTIFRWLGLGGEKEDEPFLLRSVRHFHNPLELWNEAGLKGIWDSSIIWGQRTDQSPGGKYSWQDVRNYFYLALTSEDQTTSDYYFAETFRGVGQLMHLVEDASVPLHTRDDIHIIFNYEGWVKEVQEREPDTFSEWLSDNTRYGYDKSVLSIVANPLAPVPIARIIDTDKYNGNNPDVTIYESIGIAEYSNANFFSEDTAFKDFPYPAWDSVEIADYEIEDPRDSSKTVFRQYYEKIGDGDTGYRSATVGFLKDYVLTYFPDYAIILRDDERPALDANVYRDYAERLIPRAIGYSAGLLDYFFRGEIDMLPDDEAGSGYVIENKTEEDMEGTFELYYDNSSDERVQLWCGDFTLGTVSSGNNKSSNIDFTAPDDAKEPGKYILVFRGGLGNETDAVVGKVIEPPSFWEPWGETLCENNDGWQFITYYPSPPPCQIPEDSSGAGWSKKITLIEGIISSLLTGSAEHRLVYEEDFIPNADLAPREIKIKISADVYSESPVWVSCVYLRLYYTISSNRHFMIACDPWDPTLWSNTNTVFIGDNGGEEQTIIISDYFAIPEDDTLSHIEMFSLSRAGGSASYAWDFIKIKGKCIPW